MRAASVRPSMHRYALVTRSPFVAAERPGLTQVGNLRLALPRPFSVTGPSASRIVASAPVSTVEKAVAPLAAAVVVAPTCDTPRTSRRKRVNALFDVRRCSIPAFSDAPDPRRRGRGSRYAASVDPGPARRQQALGHRAHRSRARLAAVVARALRCVRRPQVAPDGGASGQAADRPAAPVAPRLLPRLRTSVTVPICRLSGVHAAKDRSIRRC